MNLQVVNTHSRTQSRPLFLLFLLRAGTFFIQRFFLGSSHSTFAHAHMHVHFFLSSSIHISGPAVCHRSKLLPRLAVVSRLAALRLMQLFALLGVSWLVSMSEGFALGLGFRGFGMSCEAPALA